MHQAGAPTRRLHGVAISSTLKSMSTTPRGRIAVISMHTSPIEQPGVGDAGGMNVYIRSTSLELGALGYEVDIFTRATRSSQGKIVQLASNVRLINIIAGPYEGLSKEELLTQMVAFTSGIIEFAQCEKVSYSLIHSHYWMSGQVGWLLRDLWRVPQVHTAHTLALVKNSALATGDRPEPESRRICEQQIVDNADRLVVNTEAGKDNLVFHYDADPEHIDVVLPGADVTQFSPGSDRATERSRRELGVPLHATVIAFVGRMQRLKGPQVLLRAVANMMKKRPDQELRVLMCGGPSGNGLARPTEFEDLARDLGIDPIVRFLAPRPPEDLASVYRAADIVAIPSYNESFGLVAVEAQASGTPVVAARAGGLPITIDDGTSGILVDGHDPADWAAALQSLCDDDDRRIAMGENAIDHASRFSWASSARHLSDIYEDAIRKGPRVRCGSDRAGAS